MLPGVSAPTGVLAALFRVPIDYLLEVRVRGQVALAVSVPNYPDGVTFERPHATTIRHTLGEDPVREATANRYRVITIRGNSGMAARAGYSRIGLITYADGPTIVREFSEFLDNYQKMLAELPPLLKLDLVFRALTEGVALRCEIESWSWERSAQRSASTWDWQLRLRAYQDAGGVGPLSLLGKVAEAFDTATSLVQSANGYVAAAGNVVTNFRGDLETLRGPLIALQQTAGALSDAADSVRDLQRFPAVLAADFAHTAAAFQSAWENSEPGTLLANSFDPLGAREGNLGFQLQGEWEMLQRTFGYAAEDSARDAMTVLGMSGGNGGDLPEAAARASVTEPLGHRRLPLSRDLRRDVQRVSRARLRPRESLRDVAQRYYGDADRWIEIAVYNGWQSAHRLGSGRPARRGDVVLVPVEAVDQELLPSQSDPYFQDLYLGPDGDLDLTTWGDLRTIRGAANLEQAIRLRMLVVKGDSSGFPEYGLPRLIGTSGSAGTRGYIAAHISDQLLRDPRVQSVSSIVVEGDGDTYVAEAEVIPQDAAGEALTVLAPLPPAT